MQMIKLSFGFTVIMAIAVSNAHAECSVKILQDTPARESDESVLKAGSKWGPPTQFLVEPQTGNAFICAHGSYCYATDNLVLNGCKLVPMGLDDNQQPDDDIMFSVQ